MGFKASGIQGLGAVGLGLMPGWRVVYRVALKGVMGKASKSLIMFFKGLYRFVEGCFCGFCRVENGRI